MSPAEIAALLRIKQVREQRVRAALDAARRIERDAASERRRLESMQEAHDAAARHEREAAYSRVEQAGAIGSWTLQAINADLAGLTQQSAAIAGQVRKAEHAEAEVRKHSVAAEQNHRAAQRAAEAFDYLHKQARAGEEARVLDAEEFEAEETRTRPVFGDS